MSSDEVIAKLRHHAPELQAEGILHLALFGSTARNEAQPNSDIDLMAEYDDSRVRSLLDIARFQYELSDLLGAKVDISTRKLLRPIIKESAEEDAVDAF